MKKLMLVPIVAAMLSAAGCFKVASETAVKNDGSATVKLSMAAKSAVVETLKAQLDMASEQMGDENPQVAQMRELLDKFEAAFDEKKAAAEWKKLGLEVAKASSSDKDGWKGFEIEGSAKNIAEYNKAVAESRKSAKPIRGMSMVMSASFASLEASTFVTPRFPKFYKTDQPNIAKVVLTTRDSSGAQAPMPDPETLSDQQKEQIEMGLEQGRAQASLDDLKIEMRVKLPGKILSVSNCKQDGDTLVVQILGSGMTADTVVQMRQPPTATLEIDPKEFKIPLEDEPKADSRPTSRTAEKPKKDEEEKKNKDEEKDKDKDKDR
jgi:hypothetical protein